MSDRCLNVQFHVPPHMYMYVCGLLPYLKSHLYPSLCNNIEHFKSTVPQYDYSKHIYTPTGLIAMMLQLNILLNPLSGAPYHRS